MVGSRGGGRLYVVANAVNRIWEFSRLSLRADGTGDSIDLAPTAQRLALPLVPTKKVYLIPVDLGSDESLNWAPGYYRAKLGIEVEVISPISLPNDVENQSRHQVDSEQLVTHLRRKFPELVKDPANVLIRGAAR